MTSPDVALRFLNHGAIVWILRKSFRNWPHDVGNVDGHESPAPRSRETGAGIRWPFPWTKTVGPYLFSYWGPTVSPRKGRGATVFGPKLSLLSWGPNNCEHLFHLFLALVRMRTTKKRSTVHRKDSLPAHSKRAWPAEDCPSQVPKAAHTWALAPDCGP